MSISAITGGMVFHICSANWTSLFQQLGQEVATATTKFKLNNTPKAGTIQVTYGNTPTTQGTDWDYDPQINQIVLKGNLPNDGEKITVCYQI
jgi:hypothetical protein